MPTDHPGDPWWGTTYRGFSGMTGGEPPPPRRRRPGGRELLIGGVLAALILGAVVGLAVRPQLATPPSEPPMPAAQTQADGPAAGVPIAVLPPPAPPAPPSTAAPLEVLPPDMAQAARRPAAPAPTAPAPAPEAEDPAPDRDLPPPAAETPSPSPLLASFDCADARPGAEQMVCADPALAAADRQLAGAYRRAVEAGAPAAELRVEQRDWLAIREEAARHSSRALASVYDQRIEELNAIAERGYRYEPE